MGTPVDNAQKPESHANTCNPHSRGEYPPQTSGGNIVILAAHKQGRGHAAECCPEDGEAETPGGLDGVGHGREDVVGAGQRQDDSRYEGEDLLHPPEVNC
ncbi:hypothetical protein CSUB01_01306 [Colletotrichum sublineola]|uniref:Uncharacterized protein n=1 Tax=Colletotrichum sublineola TaxID=1173701 RepID=A0A066XI89_COLSU|nr:hypothetical protein CSUB01_01306 [Colletotrichum sublineola]